MSLYCFDGDARAETVTAAGGHGQSIKPDRARPPARPRARVRQRLAPDAGCRAGADADAPGAGPLQGTLPIVTDQFATVTVVPSGEIQRSPGRKPRRFPVLKPGITGSTFAPGASRPIMRGLDNYRVRIQENGIAVSDVSDIGEDHAVPIDPLVAEQIEVIRGPATLRWGSQAIGGVVNVDNNRIPTCDSAARRAQREVKGAATTVDNGLEGAVLLDAGKGNFAFHADAYGRRAGDYRIPSYPYLFPPDPAPVVDGRQPNSALRTNGQSVGGSYVFDSGFVGVAVSQFNSLYRIPGIEATETNTRIDMRQTKVTSKGEFRPQGSAIEAIRFWLGATDYKHDELAIENGFDGVQQTFTNKSQEGRVEVQLAPFDLRFAALTTALGVQASHARSSTAPGLEGGLFDPEPDDERRRLHLQRVQASPTRCACRSPGRIEQANVKGVVPDLLVDPLVNIVATASSRRRAAPSAFCRTCRAAWSPA